ncbi:MAG TPA: hypothetical protein QF764_13725 [Planctomycetota bacterium]|jgi:hypothetical protein|nr:hypothetical protein [Planctomycetota bacterium]
MKLKIALGSLVWVLVITLSHVQMNVGWTRLVSTIAGRKELVVGFLPVT